MLLVVCFFAAVTIYGAMYLIAYKLFHDRIVVEQRIQHIVKHTDSLEDQIDRAEEKKKNRKNQKKYQLRIDDKISMQLETAGVLLKPNEYLAIWGTSTVLPPVIFALFGANPITVLALLMIGFVLPPVLVANTKRKRMSKFHMQLSDALGIMSNCLRAGFTYQQAMESISKEMADPIGKEFAKTLRETRLGATVEDAMMNLVNRMQNSDLEMVVSAILIQKQVGGNLAEILDNISGTIKERIKIKGEIKVLTASGRMSGSVIGLMPLFIMGILMLLNPKYVEQFFKTSTGIMMLTIAIAMEFVGFMFIQKIVNVKY